MAATHNTVKSFSSEDLLDLLNNDLPLGVVRKVVGFEKVACEEGLQVLDVDLTSLEENMK